jgi:hypothetical protein
MYRYEHLRHGKLGSVGEADVLSHLSSSGFNGIEDRVTHIRDLTLELSGGAAVRLNEMLDGCDEVRLSEAVGLDKRRTMSTPPTNYQL